MGLHYVVQLRRTTSALQKTRQLQAMQSAYGKPSSAWGEEGPTRGEAPAAPPARLPPGAVDAETFSKARREWEAELRRVHALYEQKMLTTSKLHAAEVASLRGEGRTLAESAQAREAAARGVGVRAVAALAMVARLRRREVARAAMGTRR